MNGMRWDIQVGLDCRCVLACVAILDKNMKVMYNAICKKRILIEYWGTSGKYVQKKR